MSLSTILADGLRHNQLDCEPAVSFPPRLPGQSATLVCSSRRPGQVATARRRPSYLSSLQAAAFRRAWSVLGSYQAFDAEAIAWQVNGLDEYGCHWVMGADAEELRSVFFPLAPGDRPGAWQSVDVMCPLHGRD